MKEIKALIQPSKLYDVVMALHRVPSMPGFSTSEVRGFPRGHSGSQCQGSGTEAIQSTELVKIECVVPDALAADVIEAIQLAAHSGNPGDGKIFLYEVEDAVRIRTGERGEQVI